MTLVVVPHDPAWKGMYRDEAGAIVAALGDGAIELHHIGSTSIPGILAKPIIDILGCVDDLSSLDAKNAVMEGLGYVPKGEFGIDGRRYFRKSDLSGRRSHHLHVFRRGSSHLERHLAFRDYLRAHPAKALEYSDLKARITGGDNVSWTAYMDAKDPFIARTEAEALAWYRNA